MKRFENARVGLWSKETNSLITEYPKKVTGDLEQVKKEVFDWFYQTSCSAEEILRKCIVDYVDDREASEKN